MGEATLGILVAHEGFTHGDGLLHIIPKLGGEGNYPIELRPL